ncbi:MAG: acyloxyacyl hydrolase [Cyanobacteria bacterium J06560_2]
MNSKTSYVNAFVLGTLLAGAIPQAQAAELTIPELIETESIAAAIYSTPAANGAPATDIELASIELASIEPASHIEPEASLIKAPDLLTPLVLESKPAKASPALPTSESAVESVPEPIPESIIETTPDSFGDYKVEPISVRPDLNPARRLQQVSASEPLTIATHHETSLRTTPPMETSDIAKRLQKQPIKLSEANRSIPAVTLTEPSIAQSINDTANSTPAFGTAGTQRWYLQAGGATDLDDDAFFLAGGGISHFFHNGHSVNLELNGLAFDQPGDDAVGATLTFLVRSHWIRGEKWSLYVDGGAGIIFTTDNVPAAGSSFNFTPQIGGGASFAINENQRLMTGLRWYHISNADTFRSNPGLDTVMGYVGINFPL